MLITAETAVEMARRSVQAREERKQAAILNPPDPLANGLRAEAIQNEARLRAIKRLEKQLSAIDDKIDEATEPDDFHKLTTARSKLFEQWRILSGIPMPGSRKPAADKPARQRPAMVEPS